MPRSEALRILGLGNVDRPGAETIKRHYRAALRAAHPDTGTADYPHTVDEVLRAKESLDEPAPTGFDFSDDEVRAARDERRRRADRMRGSGFFTEGAWTASASNADQAFRDLIDQMTKATREADSFSHLTVRLTGRSLVFHNTQTARNLRVTLNDEQLELLSNFAKETS